MKWLDDRRILNAVTAFGPMCEWDLARQTGHPPWLTNSLTRLVLDKRLAVSSRPGTIGRIYEYSIPASTMKAADQ